MPEMPDHPLTIRPLGDIITRHNGDEIRVDAFLGRALALSATLPDRPYVINLCSDRYEFLLGFCAAMIAGQCTLMPPNRQRQTLLDIAGDYDGTYVLGGDAPRELEYCPVDAAISAEVAGSVPRIPDDQLGVIAFTSGSTGESKPNRKSWKTLYESMDSTARLLIDIRDRTLEIVATVPPQHMWGLEMSVLLPLLADVTISSRTPFFPGDIFDALEELPRPRALVSSPVHLDAFIKAGIGSVEIDRILTATAPMHAGNARQLEAEYSAHVIDVFGCSEAGIFAARRPTVESEWRLAEAVGLEATRDGTLVHATYLDAPVPLNDRVELLGEKRFNWIGRDNDLVNIAGKRASLAELNYKLNAVPGIRDAVIFLPDPDAKRLAALVVAPELERGDIVDALRDSFDPAFLPRPLRKVEALPRQETGKLPQKAVLELFRRTGQEAGQVANDRLTYAPDD